MHLFKQKARVADKVSTQRYVQKHSIYINALTLKLVEMSKVLLELEIRIIE